MYFQIQYYMTFISKEQENPVLSLLTQSSVSQYVVQELEHFLQYILMYKVK